MHLVSLQERLKSPDMFGAKFSQLDDFVDIIKKLNFSANAQALSISTGDGIWDYLVFENNVNITKITATDVVDNPVKAQDEEFLKRKGTWEFVKVLPEARLPFADDSFDLIIHQDVVEHVAKPFYFLQEQFRVLKPGGELVFGTPNLFRPANIFKLILGKLRFPIKIGYNSEIGDYIHIQEFYEQQMMVSLREIAFKDISVCHSFWGIAFLKIVFSKHPKGNLGKSMCQYLTFRAHK